MVCFLEIYLYLYKYRSKIDVGGGGGGDIGRSRKFFLIAIVINGER